MLWPPSIRSSNLLKIYLQHPMLTAITQVQIPTTVFSLDPSPAWSPCLQPEPEDFHWNTTIHSPQTGQLLTKHKSDCTILLETLWNRLQGGQALQGHGASSDCSQPVFPLFPRPPGPLHFSNNSTLAFLFFRQIEIFHLLVHT